MKVKISKLLSLFILGVWTTQASAEVQCKTTPNSPLSDSVFMAIVSLVNLESQEDGALLTQNNPVGCTEVAFEAYSRISICGEQGLSVSTRDVIESASRILDKCTIRIATLEHASGFEKLADGLTVVVERPLDKETE